MLGRIIDISQDGLYLRAKFGLLEVYRVKKEFAEKIADCPFEDIAALVLHAKRTRFDVELFYRIAENGGVILFCDEKFLPISVIHPLCTNFEQAKRLDYQLNATRPNKKKIWSIIVKEKILAQASVLYLLNKNYLVLKRLSDNVKTGDTENCEATAAVHYFKELFGTKFIRDRAEPGINAALNYGYTVFRAAMARAVVISGLNPNISVFHKNENSLYRLVDDLMEPFRPIIDLKVYLLLKENKLNPGESLSKETKQELANCLYLDVQIKGENSPVITAMHKLCLSLVKWYAAEYEELTFAEKRIPLELIKVLKCYQDTK